jgi:hypothetical protein
MGWPVMRYFAKAACDSDYNAGLASCASTDSMCKWGARHKFEACWTARYEWEKANGYNPNPAYAHPF